MTDYRFRNTPTYRGEYFVALTIPHEEDPLVVPCAAKVNPNGSFRFVCNVLYAYGDIEFAREQGKRMLAGHPTWTAGLYRVDRELEDSVFMCEVSR